MISTKIDPKSGSRLGAITGGLPGILLSIFMIGLSMKLGQSTVLMAISIIAGWVFGLFRAFYSHFKSLPRLKSKD